MANSTPRDPRPPGGAAAAARVALLAGLTIAILAGLLGLFAGLGMLRAAGDRAAAPWPDVGPPGEPAAAATKPSTRPAEGVAPPAGDVDPPATPAAPAVRPATASLLGVDDATRGAWVGRYGGRGYSLPAAGAAERLPPGVRATVVRSRFYAWSPATADPRAPVEPDRPAGRAAAQWFAWDDFSVDLDVRGAEEGYQVALYLLDWDGDARAQRLDVTDAETGKALLSRTDAHFGTGRYVVLRVTGHVAVRVTRVGGANCTLSGLFLDDPPPAAP